MRILLASSQSTTRFALRALLERQSGLQVVGEATNSVALLHQAESTHPDLMLLDWTLWDSRAVDLLSDLRAIYPGLVVIALSGRPELRQAAIEAGAVAFVSMVDPAEDLIAAIRSVKRVESEGCTGRS